MKNLALAILALLSLVSIQANAKDPEYLCLVDYETGFRIVNGAWQPVTFNAQLAEKYVLRKQIKPNPLYPDVRKYPYAVYDLGEHITPDYVCRKTPYKQYWCHGAQGSFRFSQKSGRFITTYLAGYWDGSNTNGDTPNIAIGMCKKI